MIRLVLLCASIVMWLLGFVRNSLRLLGRVALRRHTSEITKLIDKEIW